MKDDTITPPSRHMPQYQTVTMTQRKDSYHDLGASSLIVTFIGGRLYNVGYNVEMSKLRKFLPSWDQYW